MKMLPLFFFIFFHSALVGDCFKITSPLKLEEIFKLRQYDKFAEILGIIPELILPGGPVPFSTVETYTFEDFLEKGNLEQTDILLTPQQKKERLKWLHYSTGPGKRWNTKRIPYAILESTFNTSRTLNIVKSGIQRFNEEINTVQLSPWNYKDKDCVVFYYAHRRYSNIGYVGGLQSIGVPNDDMFLGRILHLIGHTLGFSHEITRPDRDEYIRINFNNIPKAIHQMFVPGNPKTYKIYGPYDYYSIMHSPVDLQGFQDAYTVLKPNIDMSIVGKLLRYSDMDKLKVERLYQNVKQK